MKAMILAAGLGKRMLPLTASTPKPLLPIAGKPLLFYHLESLRVAGFTDVVINVSYLAEQIIDAVGDGSQFDLSVQFSRESSPLETCGGILQAWPLLFADKPEEPLLVINGDVHANIHLANFLHQAMQSLLHGQLGCLLLVKNPAFHPQGDFCLADEQRRLYALDSAYSSYTFAGVSLLQPQLFTSFKADAGRLASLFHQANDIGRLDGLIHQGYWFDVGTPERLAEAEAFVTEYSARFNRK